MYMKKKRKEGGMGGGRTCFRIFGVKVPRNQKLVSSPFCPQRNAPGPHPIPHLPLMLTSPHSPPTTFPQNAIPLYDSCQHQHPIHSLHETSGHLALGLHLCKTPELNYFQLMWSPLRCRALVVEKTSVKGEAMVYCQPRK